MSLGNISNSFLQEFDFLFRATLKDRGSRLMQFTTIEPIMGESKYFRQYNVGMAREVTDVHSPTQYMPVTYDKRLLKPRPIEGALTFDDYDNMRQANPPIEQLAQEAADSCGLVVDQIILGGIIGPAIADTGVKILDPVKNFVKWNSNKYLGITGVGGDTYPPLVRAGMNVSKLFEAKEKLRSAHINRNSPIVCLLSEKALTQFIADPAVKNMLYNKQGPAMSQGEVMEYGGIMLIPFEQGSKIDPMPKPGNGLDPTTGYTIVNETQAEYAYMYAIEHIITGEKPLQLKMGQNAERGLNDVLIYKGMYDTVRMAEEAVIKIELIK